MKNIIAFLLRFHYTILFIFLQVIALILLYRTTSLQQNVFLNAGNAVSGKIYEFDSDIRGYFNLKETNRLLALENSILRSQIRSAYLKNDTNSFWVNDTVYTQQYRYFVAKVIHNSVNKRNNYMMLDKGSMNGIQKDMAVLTPDGVAGKVISVSKHYSWVMSVLNKQSRISAKILKNNQIGTVIWNGMNYRYGTLTDIPAHVKLQKGDTIVTSGYSDIFPEGIPLGVIEDFRIEHGDHFFVIPFRFTVDLNSLQYVYIADNRFKKEQDSLMNSGEEVVNE